MKSGFLFLVTLLVFETSALAVDDLLCEKKIVGQLPALQVPEKSSVSSDGRFVIKKSAYKGRWEIFSLFNGRFVFTVPDTDGYDNKDKQVRWISKSEVVVSKKDGFNVFNVETGFMEFDSIKNLTLRNRLGNAFGREVPRSFERERFATYTNGYTTGYKKADIVIVSRNLKYLIDPIGRTSLELWSLPITQKPARVEVAPLLNSEFGVVEEINILPSPNSEKFYVAYTLLGNAIPMGQGNPLYLSKRHVILMIDPEQLSVIKVGEFIQEPVRPFSERNGEVVLGSPARSYNSNMQYAVTFGTSEDGWRIQLRGKRNESGIEASRTLIDIPAW